MSNSRAPLLLTPFPVVRLRGLLLDSGVRVNLLTVQAPAGSLITIKCRGPVRSCPRARSTRIAFAPITTFPSFNRRMRPGTFLQIYVTKPGFVGKYTRFTIRRRSPPIRADGCAHPDITVFSCR